MSQVWYHGTKSSIFSEWQCPPPRKEAFLVAHSAICFTRNKDFASACGPNIASAQILLNPRARIVQPAVLGEKSAKLRKELLRGCGLASHNRFLKTDSDWRAAWRSGEIMRFEPDQNSEAQQNLRLHLRRSEELLRNAVHVELGSNLSPEDWSKMAAQNFTRGWIEEIIRAASRCRFQAIQGAEIDRHSGENQPPARSWLAVLDAAIISKPDWEIS